MYIVNIRHEFIWRRTHELASASPPYEQVPTISQYTFNYLFIIQLSHSSSSFICTIYIKNQNIILVYQPKNCFKFEITLCHLVSSYICKTTPNGAKVKMTFCIGCDVSKQTLTLTRIRRHFHVLLSCISYENLHYYPQNLLCRNERLKVNQFLIIIMQFIQRSHH